MENMVIGLASKCADNGSTMGLFFSPCGAVIHALLQWESRLVEHKEMYFGGALYRS